MDLKNLTHEELKKLGITRWNKLPENLRLNMGEKKYSGKELANEIKQETEVGKLILEMLKQYLVEFGTLPSEQKLIKEVFPNG